MFSIALPGRWQNIELAQECKGYSQTRDKPKDIHSQLMRHRSFIKTNLWYHCGIKGFWLRIRQSAVQECGNISFDKVWTDTTCISPIQAFKQTLANFIFTKRQKIKLHKTSSKSVLIRGDFFTHMKHSASYFLILPIYSHLQYDDKNLLGK